MSYPISNADKALNALTGLMRNHPVLPANFSPCKCGRQDGSGGLG